MSMAPDYFADFDRRQLEISHLVTSQLFDNTLSRLRDWYDESRNAKDYATSDKIRSLVAASGWDLNTGKDGISVLKRNKLHR